MNWTGTLLKSVELGATGSSRQPNLYVAHAGVTNVREVEASQFVRARPAELQRWLTPERLVEHEGSFEVRHVEERADDWLVAVGGRGLAMELRFETREDGIFYEQRGESGPLRSMWTRVTIDSKDEGSTVTARSGVSLGLPLAGVTDRVAAWKRRGELKRLLDGIAGEFG